MDKHRTQEAACRQRVESLYDTRGTRSEPSLQLGWFALTVGRLKPSVQFDSSERRVSAARDTPVFPARARGQEDGVSTTDYATVCVSRTTGVPASPQGVLSTED